MSGLSVDQKMAAFEAVAKTLIEQSKRLIDFHVLVLKQDRGISYRVFLEIQGGRKKTGFAMAGNVTMKEFEKTFIEHLENLIK